MAVRNDFTAGEVLAAADLNDTFGSKVDYATPTNAQAGTAYTFVADDAERITTASNGSAVTFTIPPQSSVTWADDTILRVVNYGAGALTVDGGSGVTVTNTATTVAQYQAAAAIRTGSDAWTLVPFAGGGEIPAAEISSPAATGQYTDTGVTYDYYTFTSSGTLTVDTGGFADVLIVGGGGGGGQSAGGGGGAGAHLYITDAYLAAGTATVTVGAGGSGATVTAGATEVGNNGIASRIGSYYAPGGGYGSGASWTVSTGNYYSVHGGNGGSGGGSCGFDTGATRPAGLGISGLGNNGGTAAADAGGGGGGAGGTGSNGSGTTGAAGGAGTANSITGSSVTRAGGGGGAGGSAGGAGGSGGGGAGVGPSSAGNNGTANTGSGGGSAYSVGSIGGNGGSGVVIVRVKV